MKFWEIASYLLVYNLLRYVLVAGLTFLLFYVLFKNRWRHWKIQSKFPKWSDYFREIVYSLITISIFLGVAISIYASPLKTYTLRYSSIAEYGWFYWFLSIFLMIILHDTYFYWMHRLMHHPKIYRRVHLVHHKSTNPSPWAAYAFHPLEAFFEASIIFFIVFLIPYHPMALFTFLMFMIVYNVYGHLGYELYPKGFNRTIVGRWINTSINHNQHHAKVSGNYGLYFLFWDRWLGTIREDYDDAFQANDVKRTNSSKMVNIKE